MAFLRIMNMIIKIWYNVLKRVQIILEYEKAKIVNNFQKHY